MKTLSKIAKPCGIVGGVGTMLLSLLVFSFTPAHTTVTAISRDETGQILSSVTEKSFASGNLLLLIFTGVTAVMGLLALVSILALKNKPRLRSTLMWVSIAGIIVCGLFSLGLLLLPAAVLLILATVGMKKRQLFTFIICLLLLLAIPVLNGCTGDTATETDVSENVTSENAIAEVGVLEGKCMIRPRLPEELGQSYSPETYQPRKVMVYDADHAELVSQADLDENGYYRIELPPGNYSIDINYYGADHSENVPRKLKIEPGVHVMFDIDFNTGVPAGSWLIGENFYYGQGCIWGDTLAGLEYEYEEGKIAGQYIVTFNLNSHEKKRVVEIPEGRMANTPSIYEDKIVWASADLEDILQLASSSVFRQPAPNYDIFLFDSETNEVTQLTTEEHAQTSPQLYGDTVVWLDARHQAEEQYPMSYDVYAYDLKTRQETRVTANTTVEGYNQLAIDGNTIVWTDMRHADPEVSTHPSNDAAYNNEIYAYDLSTGEERRLTTSPQNDQSPDISGNIVTWLRQENFQQADMFSYDLASGLETQISHSGYASFSPSVYDGSIAWTDSRASQGNTNNDVIINGQGPGADIYLYDLETKTETRLTETEDWKVWCYPVVHGDHVVFQWSRQIGAMVCAMSLP